jgi:hypothetical protein
MLSTPSVFASTSLFQKRMRRYPRASSQFVRTALSSGVPSAIDFDDAFPRRVEEIDDIGSERMLATEAETFELLSTQARP